MRAVLMAGGSGTRLRPLTCDLPKPMVPILNRPIAEHLINLLKRHHITEVIITLHYLPDIIRDYFQDGSDWGIRITYAVEEDQPLGTAGCMGTIAELLGQTFLVISGDSITDVDLGAAIAFHYEKGSMATLILTRVPNPLEFGVVITDSDQRITRFLEKPSSGEIFSDTVNTGIYILNADVLGYLPQGQESDFSRDLFPRLLADDQPMYGYVAEGYWCDVGHLDGYRETQYHGLQRRVQLDFPYPDHHPGIWIGENTNIDPTAKLEAPCMIGANCRIGAGVMVAAGTIIGDNTTVFADADLNRPIIWSGAIIGEESRLHACVIGRGVRVDRRAHIMEGVIIGSLSVVGEESWISPNVRVWPSKRIEAGATVNLNLIWGQSAQRYLFGQHGVAGLANIDITPEFAVKLGAAYGSILKPKAEVTVSRDQRMISRMVSRSLISGLMSVGVNVQNLQATAIPIARTLAPTLSVSGGIHVRICPERPDYLLIEFYDAKGINISKVLEKKIEGAFFKEDLRRAQIHEIGNMLYPSQALDIYSKAFEEHINTQAIRFNNSKIVIDYVYAVSGAILPQLLGKFGCDAVVLNASLSQTVPSTIEREMLLHQLGQVVCALQANFGVQVFAHGEKLIVVDESGTAIRDESLTLLMVYLMMTAHPHGTVVVPVHAPSAVEEIVHRFHGQVVRTKANPTALMEACQMNRDVILGGSGNMGFIFPELHPGFDAMFCIAKLIEMLTIQEQTLGQIRMELPQMAYQVRAVRCPWKVKGALMRHLVETYPSQQLELVDGVKIFNPLGFGDFARPHDSWILILPDAGEPLVNMYANSPSSRWVDQMLDEYGDRIQRFIHCAIAAEAVTSDFSNDSV